MTGATRLFTVLQHGDSFFPSGLTSFSCGLEQLFEEKRITDADSLRHFIEAELRFRWASFDRVFLSASHRAAGDTAVLASIDRLCHGGRRDCNGPVQSLARAGSNKRHS